ncbi:hypothetical protein M9H77_25908 [Catharanthus roseus]|uniref:Uncharacterized protein n=1 Tax=Catharanthus roseus TaxID=4058 RepID=A0ACC0A8A0_CATRO|nr:hypothetical protein M9H77_25908 [Catharanthus roseus]
MSWFLREKTLHIKPSNESIHYVFDWEGGENFDFEDENEGPLEKVDDMITIDVVDDSSLHNLVSLEGVVDGTETEIVENQFNVSGNVSDLVDEAGPSADQMKVLVT